MCVCDLPLALSIQAYVLKRGKRVDVKCFTYFSPEMMPLFIDQESEERVKECLIHIQVLFLKYFKNSWCGNAMRSYIEAFLEKKKSRVLELTALMLSHRQISL